MDKKFLTTEEVMDYLGISRATLRRYINEHGMPVIRVTSRKNLHDVEAINEWLQKRSGGGRKD